MRKTLLLSAALIGLSATAMAQTAGGAAPATPDTTPSQAPAASGMSTQPPINRRHVVRPVHRAAAMPPSGDIRPGHEPGVGQSYPLSGNASNITAGDTRSTIAPTLPTPPGGANASVRTYLTDAQRALSANRTGTAQEALERAETAMLQRSVPVDQANTPDQAPDVMQVKAARDALANHDIASARRAVDAAISAGS